MNYAKKQNFIKITAIIVLIIALINLIFSFCDLFVPKLFEEYLAEYQTVFAEISSLAELTVNEIATYVLSLSIFFEILALLGGISLLILSKLKEDSFQKYKALFFASLIIEIACGGIVSIILCIVCFRNEYNYKNSKNSSVGETPLQANEYGQPSFPQDEQTLKLSMEVQKLKILRDNGSITEEEYLKMLKDIIK